MYQCTWPACAKIHNTCYGIEKHVRTRHMSVDEADDLSDHEDEFYYTEIEVNVDNVTKTFSDMFTSSPPDDTSYTDMQHSIPDHDYQKKQSSSSRSSKMTMQERMQQHQAQLPKSHMLSSPPKSINMY